MIETTAYVAFKNGQIIASGLCPTFYVHGLIASIVEIQHADNIQITFNSGYVLIIKSPNVLFKSKPAKVSIEDHTRWCSGCRYNLE